MPSAAEAAMFGLTQEEASPPPVALWPCVEEPTNVFAAMHTQWRVAEHIPIGLDYAALPAVLDLLRVKRKRRARLFDDIRVMEGAALAYLHDEINRQRKPS